ncbi:hypothetical protein COW83_00325 [Candidatus Collierbacteria bacterium CG22_combo_CG10-13_8_21_14_all_43_12]|uniref:Amine oxidase domain-containing protein n=1 Tax=Candidatus Collierbacteria bacterium CG22_combo_CG10-13_8_21_14_all_43_12 TaxID=1974537 RepID=A0A2H0DWE3_9BACT|nr:MAG: hypothetical protein COW83_00325 [Candidatus Collierbacteria bacterium CG22_combo_CG10-13_8_21_14_all_43_12]
MRVAIIGGGFVGLSSAVYLADRGHQPVVFEASDRCGGLAKGFKGKDWRWSLENFYHHIFTNDREIVDFSKKVGCKLNIKHPMTSSFFRFEEIELDSPLSLLRFSGISVWSRLRMGVGLLLLKLIPDGLFLERYKAVEALPKLLGKAGYKVVWEKLLVAKFGPYADQVNLAWFWSRVAKRTKNLGYFEGGFTGLIDKTVENIKKHGGEIRMGVEVKTIQRGWIHPFGYQRPDQVRDDSVVGSNVDGGVMVNGEKFDAVVITTPAPIAKKILGGWIHPFGYQRPDQVRDDKSSVGKSRVTELNYLWGQTVIMEVSQKLIKGYWMNILENDFPFLVVVEHTNMINKKWYGEKNIVYLGNYLPEGHKQLMMTKEQLVALYLPFIKKINWNFNQKQIMKTSLFRKPFAQPVFPVNYSRMIPNPRVGLGVYLANMSMVYPFDRGTNYAVKLGNDIAELVVSDLR